MRGIRYTDEFKAEALKQIKDDVIYIKICIFYV